MAFLTVRNLNLICSVILLVVICGAAGSAQYSGLVPFTAASVPAPRITEYRLGAFNKNQGLGGNGALSVDGSVWVSDSDSVMKIAPNGVPLKRTFIADPACSPGLNCTFVGSGLVYRGADRTIWFGTTTNVGTAVGGGMAWVNSSGSIQGSIGLTSNGTPSGNPTVGADGRVWIPINYGCFGAPCNFALSAISAGGTEVDYALGEDTIGGAAAAAPDRNIYLTAFNLRFAKAYVAQFATNGKLLHRFALPAEGYAMAAGADGNLWIIENQINEIARMTPGGVVTQFRIPTPNAGALNIVRGTDGNMWFTESAANKIGRITTCGKITEYRVPTPGAFPDGIMGPDALGHAIRPHGYIWFTEDGADAVARLEF